MFCSAVDVISAIQFDNSGDHLATGDRGGRVVLFERTDAKNVMSLLLASCKRFFFLKDGKNLTFLLHAVSITEQWRSYKGS